MHQNDALINDVSARSDRVLIAALAILIATFSAAAGAGLANHPAHSPAISASRAPVVVQLAAPPSVMLDVPAADLLAEHSCLAEALYYEARGEGLRGEQAVAEVIFHRLTIGRYGHSICAVVYEGANRPGCQFSFTCDGSIRHLREAAAWKDAEQLAEQILTGAVRLSNDTGSAINYHAATVSPYWAPTLRKTAQIGNHIFYRNNPVQPVSLRNAAQANGDDPMLVADASRSGQDARP